MVVASSYAGRRLLAVFPHPDDEAYAAAGSLALAADHGATVRLITATRGENGSDRSHRVASGPALAEVRSAELTGACRVLGIEGPHFLELPDGAIDAADRDALEQIVGILLGLRPHVVITLGRDGVYGHCDHIALTALVTAALVQVAEDRPGTRLLHVAFPRDLFRPVLRGLRRSGSAAVVNGRIDLGTHGDSVDIRVATSASRDRKLAAVSAHRTQLVGGDPHTFLKQGLIDHLLDEEWFHVISGPPAPSGACDLFAGL
jgi:LmbE family N-acetylglucosaminyl deacetylase